MLWERKAEAYNDVLNALSDLKHYSELLAKQAYGAKFTEEHQARLKERHLDGYHKLRSARTIGGFILSEAVAQRLEKLARQDDTIDRDSGPPWEYYEEISGAYADALTDIRAAAKKDLKVE